MELNVGDLIFQGDVVQTRTDSTLAIAFSDGSAFTLNENARMVLNEFVYDPDSASNSAVINLVQGTVSFIAAQVAKAGNMRVETPTATMGIRGTFVTVSVSSVDGNTVASLGLETHPVTGEQYSGAFTLTNRITNESVTVNNVATMFAVSPVGNISESAKPPAIAAIEAATFQALVPVMAAAANNAIGPTGAAPTGPAQGPNVNQGQNDQSSQSSTRSQSSGSGGSSGSSAPTTPDKITVPLTQTTAPTDTTTTGQTNSPTTNGPTTNTTTVVTPAADNTPHVTPTGTVTNFSDTETASSQIGSFNIMSQVSVANPGSPTAYVNGSAALTSATASGGVPSGAPQFDFPVDLALLQR